MMRHRRRMLMQASQGGGRLPPGYQEVEYITIITKGSSVDLGFKYYNSEEELEIKFYSASTNPGNATFGSFSGTSAAPRNCFYNFNGGMGGAVVTADDTGYSAINNVSPVGQINTLNVNGTRIQNNGKTISNPARIIGESTSNMFLFDRGANKVYAISGTRIYYLLTKKNGVLTRYFVPCYRKSDNKIGVYDVIGRTFHAGSGTGTLGKGADVI